MQVRYGTSPTQTWLTGTEYAEDAGPLLISGRALVQVSDLVRGTTPNIRGMGNKAITIPVPVVLQYDSWLDALRYTHERFWDLPDDGELLFREQWGTGQLDILYPTAALQTVTSRRIGEVAVEHTYNFVVAGPPTFTVTSDVPLRITGEDGTYITTEN